MDKISHLPEEILHEILSHLPEKDAVRTCVLSKKWQQIKAREPARYFNELAFFKTGHGQTEEGYREAQKKLFINYVDSQLECFFRQNVGPLRRFHLTYDPEHDSGRVDFWLKRVMKGLKYFYLHVCSSKVDYSVPHFVFDSETLTQLTLHHCNLDACRNIKLPKLKWLFIGSADLDEDFITRFIFGCPLLKDLNISRCRKLTSLHVTSLPQVQRVALYRCLDLRNVAIQSPQCVYVGSRQKPCELAFQTSNLVLGSTKVTSAWLQQQASKCEKLTMVNICGLEDIKISSRNLRRLTIMSCEYMENVAEIDCPNLHTLVYTKNRLPFRYVNNLQLCKIFLRFRLRDGQLSTIWLDHLKDLCSGRELIKQVIMSDGHEDVVILEGLFECMLTALHETEELMPNPKVLITTSSNSEQVDLLLYNMLFGCPTASYKTLNVISASSNNSSFSQVICDKLSRTKAEANCCGNRLKKCWRHYICNVKMDSSGNNVPAVLRSYQSETYQISRIMLEWDSE